MMGPDDIFNNAQKLVMSADPQIAPVPSAWDNSLADDGLSEDSIAEDGIYGATVILSGTSQLVENQTVFFDVTSGADKFQFGFVVQIL